MKHPGGSGRGKKGVEVISDPTRPECKRCGGFMKSNGAKDWQCSDCGYNQVKAPKRQDDFLTSWGFDTERAENHAKKCEKKKRIIVTSAQNNTDVFSPFWKALKQAAACYKAEIAVIPVHYKNITLMEKDQSKEWCKQVSPYLVKGDIQFNNVLIRSDMKINATSLNPLQGKQPHGGNNWVVFGHAQMAMEPVPTPGDMMPKRLYTTGSCTLENYSVSDLGERARFHHTMGALLIEKHKDHVFIRQLNCDDNGHFYDLDKRFTSTGWTKGHSALSLTTGDEHVKFNKVEKETYTGRGSVVGILKPKYIVRHDVLDGYAGSHHHHRDPVTQFKKHHSGDNNYRAELRQVVDFINRTTPKGSISLIVPSNHHDHLDKYLATADANKDHENAILICELQAEIRKAALKDERHDALYLYMKDRLKCEFEFLDRSKPYLIGGVDHAQHGDVGVNGSRGSAAALSRSTFKMTVGHSHSARICKGVFQVGTSTGKLEYERGLGTHSNTHCIQYKNGKRTLIDIINGRWKA